MKTKKIMSELTLQNKIELLLEPLKTDRVKREYEHAISYYNKGKEDPNALLNVKDQLNSLMFYLAELISKAKALRSEAAAESEKHSAELFIHYKSEINETTGRLYSDDMARYMSRGMSVEHKINEIFAQKAVDESYRIYNYCKDYRDNATQRISILKEEVFSSRQLT